MKTLVVGDKRNTALRMSVLRALIFSSGIAGMSGRNPFSGRAAPKKWRRTFQHMSVKPKAKIFKILKITAGRNHAWCDSDKGTIRKAIWSIPAEIVAEYRGGGCEHT